jgi:integrase
MKETVFASNALQMPRRYAEFIEEARVFVASRGLSWDIPLDGAGQPAPEADWDLRGLTGSHARTASRTNGFAVDTVVRELARKAGWNVAHLPAGAVLGADAQDFIKAVVAHRCRARREPRSVRHWARVLRSVLSTTTKAPWNLSTEDFDRFLSLDDWPLSVTSRVSDFARLMTSEMLSNNGAIAPAVGPTLTERLAARLDERKSAEKLPDKAALLELTRIVFQEAAETHNDVIRFCAIRLLLLTGLRLNEVLSLPTDCLRWEEHIDVVTGRRADEVGGVGRTLHLRYFAEKSAEGGPDVLVEATQTVPERFATHVENAVVLAQAATRGLRETLREQMDSGRANPRSDARRFKTTTGRLLASADLLLLVEVGVSRARDTPVSSDAAIAPVSVNSMYQFLGLSSVEAKSTLFSRYGRTTATRSMRVKPHSLRHLLNTELFRQGVPDTVITNHFGRRTVAQSYQYDHRTLAERLAFVTFPGAARNIVPSGRPEELVAKMVVSGAAPSSHLARSFRAIQAEHGDSAAFAYLAANSDGFHVTPYGFCTNSFSVNPCVRHLKCFDDCKHFTASGRPEHRTTLEQLRERLADMRDAALARPATTIGRKNQVEHANRLLAGAEAALAAHAGAKVFPHGLDHSAPTEDLFR